MKNKKEVDQKRPPNWVLDPRTPCVAADELYKKYQKQPEKPTKLSCWVSGIPGK